MDLSQKVSVIIRSAKERTVDLCRTLLTQQVSAQNVQVIQEVPFTAAIKKGFEIGLDYGLPWTLIVDADVLISENAVSELLALAEQEDETMILIHGKSLDKLMHGFRSVGLRLYRTAYLRQALAHIPQNDESIRPETTTIRRTKAAHGYISVQKDLISGLHDYEQYYRDIYRKAFVHAHKHRRHLSYLQAMWQRLAKEDPDYETALWGIQDGLAYQGKVSIDTRQFSEDRINELLSQSNRQEKSTLSHQALTSTDVSTFLKTTVLSPEYWAGWYLSDKSNGPLQARLQKVIQKIGWSNMLSLLTSSYLHRFKYKLQKLDLIK